MVKTKNVENSTGAGSDQTSVNINTHGRTFVGTVIAAKMQKTATVEWNRTRYLPKYERTAKARSRVKAHNDIDAKKGDIVKIQECRPLSKTKQFIITEILGQNTEYMAREQLFKESRISSPKETAETKEQPEGKEE
jgi:small subunit ribosomal protein S17